jgi:hypothetical protein
MRFYKDKQHIKNID